MIKEGGVKPTSPSRHLCGRNTSQEAHPRKHISARPLEWCETEITLNVWNNYTVVDDLSQLLTWLSPLDPGLRSSDIQERRVNHVRGWLMGTEEFARWNRLSGEGEGDERVLFCYGNSGVGKAFN